MKLFEKTTVASCVSQVASYWSSRHGVAWNKSVRIEIHSLDEPPWPTERPDGWGVGWWCEVSGRQAGICRRLYGDPSALQVEIVFPFDGYWVAGCLITGYMNIIVTSYGPKMEIPR